MDINEFLAIGVVGAVTSGIIELINRKWIRTSNGAKLVTVVVSVAIASVYYYIRSTPLFATVLAVLASASTVYALLLPKGSN